MHFIISIERFLLRHLVDILIPLYLKGNVQHSARAYWYVVNLDSSNCRNQIVVAIKTKLKYHCKVSLRNFNALRCNQISKKSSRLKFWISVGLNTIIIKYLFLEGLWGKEIEKTYFKLSALCNQPKNCIFKRGKSSQMKMTKVLEDWFPCLPYLILLHRGIWMKYISEK